MAILNLGLGRLTATAGVADWTAECEEATLFVSQITRKFLTGDWGDLHAEDWQSNDYAAAHGERIVASYPIPDTFDQLPSDSYGRTHSKLWLISEFDRSRTTILTPGDY
jgi:hypothetical protein